MPICIGGSFFVVNTHPYYAPSEYRCVFNKVKTDWGECDSRG